MEVGRDLDIESESALSPESLAGRLYLGKAFRRSLIITPVSAISALLCFANALNYFEEHPRHFCDLTKHCEQLLSLPIFVCGLGAVTLVPVLLTLDHFLAISPIFRNKTPRDDEHSEGNESSPSGSPRCTRFILGTFALVAYLSAILWAVATASATTSAALIIKYDSPFDDKTDSKYRIRVYTGLAEAFFDLSLVFLVVPQGIWYWRARKSVQPATQDFKAAVDETFNSVVNTTLSDVWQTLWHARTALDKAIFCILSSYIVLTASALLYSSSSHPTWQYFFGSYYFYTVIFTYPFLITFHKHRMAGSSPGSFVRGFAFFFFSMLTLLWIVSANSFIAVFAYGLFCDPWAQEPGPLPCRPREGLLPLSLALLDALLAAAMASCAVTAWRSRGSIQLQPDSVEGGEADNRPDSA